jgi:hypothetical protein
VGEQRGGVGGTAELQVERAQQPQGVGVIGVGGEGATIAGLGVGEAAGLVVAGGGEEAAGVTHRGTTLFDLRGRTVNRNRSRPALRFQDRVLVSLPV